jgi:hypothetical protein
VSEDLLSCLSEDAKAKLPLFSSLADNSGKLILPKKMFCNNCNIAIQSRVSNVKTISMFTHKCAFPPLEARREPQLDLNYEQSSRAQLANEITGALARILASKGFKMPQWETLAFYLAAQIDLNDPHRIVCK